MESQVEGLPFNTIKSLFGISHSKTAILKAEAEERIPRAHRVKIGDTGREQRIWDFGQVALIGERYGFLKHPEKPTVVTIFSTKGGILKSTLALNIARTHALHNIKTVVVDLDPQGDSSKNLGLDLSEDSFEDLDEVDKKLEAIGGLFDVKTGRVSLNDILQPTDLPTLQFIPANSELVPLMELIGTEVRREYWIKENVIEPLKALGYELIILDLAPSWSLYTSNALAASNLLVSPLECKIAHYRNIREFTRYLDGFIKKMGIGNQLQTLFVPVKTSATRKLSMQIKQFYHNAVPGCSHGSIRESVTGEEAVANRVSVLEYSQKSTLAEEVKELMIEINSKMATKAKERQVQ